MILHVHVQFNTLCTTLRMTSCARWWMVLVSSRLEKSPGNSPQSRIHVQVAKAFRLFTDKLCECGLRCESAWLISVFSAIHLHT